MTANGFIPSRLHSYSFRVPTQWVCVGTTPATREPQVGAARVPGNYDSEGRRSLPGRPGYPAGGWVV